MVTLDEMFEKFNTDEISNLTDELKAMFIYKRFVDKRQTCLVVANTLFEANKLYQMIANYTTEVLFFPMDDFITSEVLAVSPEFKINRLTAINHLLTKKPYIVVTNLMGYLRFLPQPTLFIDSYLKLETDKQYNFEKLISKLDNIGYERETMVNKSGQVAVRGYVIDIFPINESNPIRLEFWGDNLESIRHFDINSQLTTSKSFAVTIMPNSEFITQQGLTSNLQRDLIKHSKVASIHDYCFNPVVIYNDYQELKKANYQLQSEIVEYRNTNNIEISTIFMNDFVAMKYDINLCNFDNKQNNNSLDANAYKLDIKYKDFSELKVILDNYIKNNKTVIICVTNRDQANSLIEQINSKIVFTNEKQIFNNSLNVIIKKITEGFIFDNFVVISTNTLFSNHTNYTSYKGNLKLGTKIKDITKINIGDYVVHQIYGIGRYCGIKTIKKNDLQKDYLQLEYKDSDKLYIPVEKIEQISKYSSSDGMIPRINKLNSLDWEKTKMKARKRAHDMADELLKLYISRELVEGFAFDQDDENQLLFEKEFIYEESLDQIKVTEEIKKDMESPHPMDRLLCGDVGYGKTEVAFRAVFKAILSKKQVILLCPTTILSTQHYQNAVERFKNFPINIRLLNRFVTTKETNKTIQEIKNGQVDFVIGTHKVLNNSVEFKDLGLLIIDEEQRFGVSHKEKIKKYKNNIDVLALSATPIPRTLQLSMANIRSLSLIETPPNNRFPVQTYVVEKNNTLVKEAINKELSRKGQVFIVHNHIDSIESKVREISELVKEARVAYAHGRMNKEQLENIMIDFIDKKYDILVCTTIIESGIDIPNVNTLIVMGADYFGLSQLYQIRGRVGRADKIAYCYLMYDNNKVLSEIATKRLKAIKEFTELGSGFQVALRDLSIRGAGDILGQEQAGFIASVGLELFMQMLNEEVNKIKGNHVDQPDDNIQPLLDVNTYIDDKYVLDEQLKIIIHRKINEIDSLEKLNEVKSELEDRFGKINNDLVIYMHEQLFEYKAKQLNINNIKQTDKNIQLILDKQLSSKIDGEKLFMSLLDLTSCWKINFRGGHLIIILEITKLDKHFIYYLIDLLEIIKKASR